MKVGTYSRLCAPLFGCALLWTSAACGSRTSLLQEEDAGVAMDTPAQESSSGNSGGRAGSSVTSRAGRGAMAMAGAGGAAGRAASGGRAGRAGRGGEPAEAPRGGAGGRMAPPERDAAADSGENEEQPARVDAGAEQLDAGMSGAPAADSGSPDAGQLDAGSEIPEGSRLTELTPEQTDEICTRIESATENQPWQDALSGWCARGTRGTEECPSVQAECVMRGVIPDCRRSMPDCPEVTIEEFVTCRTDELLSFVEYNRTITCDSADLAREARVESCVAPYERCPALAALDR